MPRICPCGSDGAKALETCMQKGESGFVWRGTRHGLDMWEPGRLYVFVILRGPKGVSGLFRLGCGHLRTQMLLRCCSLQSKFCPPHMAPKSLQVLVSESMLAASSFTRALPKRNAPSLGNTWILGNCLQSSKWHRFTLSSALLIGIKWLWSTAVTQSLQTWAHLYFQSSFPGPQ